MPRSSLPSAASPLRLAKSGSLSDLTFEDAGAARYNLYVSNRPSGHPFKVLSPSFGEGTCSLAGLVALAAVLFPGLLAGEAFFLGDFHVAFEPTRAVLARAYRAGSPLWTL